MLKRPTFSFSHHPPHRSRFTSRASELGFTLVELVVCIAILGVVIIPMSATMLVGFRSTEASESGLTASVNRDQISEQFTKDVAQVDAAGVSTDPTRTCGSPSDATLFVNLNRTRINGGSPQIDRISYFSTGSGKNIGIVRYSCTNVSATASASGTKTVVAKRLGDVGQTRADVVLAIYSTDQLPDGSFVGRVPCTEFQCGFEIDGRHKMQITAQRRLFGAGVPVEAGKIYSSSATRQAKVDGSIPGVKYDLYGTTDATNGVDSAGTGIDENEKVGAEGTFTNQLTLPAGLDGPSKMTVRFAVQSMTARTTALPQGESPNVCSSGQCRFLTGTGGTFTATQKTWINGDYSTGVWRLPLPVGPSDPAKFGGEYRIYTELTPTGQPTKEFGGTNGFPFWIDWRPSNSVFVKQNATGDGLTPQTPAPTLALAFNQASVNFYNRPNIVVTNGSYVEQLDLRGNSLAAGDTSGNISNNRTITGGHDSNWLRGPAYLGEPAATASADQNGIYWATPASTQIKSPANTGWVMKIEKRTGLHFRQVGINNGATSGLAAGTSTYGVIILGNSWVKFEKSSIRSGKAADGVSGTEPPPALDGCRGGGGTPKSTSTNQGRQPAPGHTTNYNGNPAYQVGAVNCNPTDPAQAARRSGNGGGGGGATWYSASAGAAGGYGSGSPAAVGGNGGGGGACGSASRGNPGGASSSAAGGITGSTTGTAVRPNDLWSAPVSATPSQAGAYGRGGGGAGGGGGSWCFDWSAGASGGAGGEGGMPGQPGPAGGNGGGSFAIYTFGNSTALLLDARVKAGKGGKGGNGGKGGQGGYGGIGGYGVYNGTLGEDSSGGGGGGGGGGGAGGPAGIGGPSVSLAVHQNSRAVVTSDNPRVPEGRGSFGAPGEGGVGGAGGKGGDGAYGSIDFFFFTVSFSTPGGSNGVQGVTGDRPEPPSGDIQPPECAFWSFGSAAGYLGDPGQPAGDSRTAKCVY